MSLIKAAGAGEQSTGFYKLLLDQSLKFNRGETPRLSRTWGAAATDDTTWTVSMWVKRSSLTGSNDWHTLFSEESEAWTVCAFYNDTLYVQINAGGAAHYIQTNRLFRDFSAWYHIVVAFDEDNGTAAHRLRLYINGVEETSFATDQRNSISSSSNSNWNTNGKSCAIGARSATNNSLNFNGYIAEFNNIDGQQLTPSSFGETKDGIWIPKDTSGLTFGTNGFHLTFKDDVISEGFNTVTWTGTGADNSISGIGFSPAFVWIKDRTDATAHYLFDVCRGALKDLYSNLTAAEYSAAQTLKSFDGDGFTVGNNTGVNGSADDMVAWCWEAGGTPTADNSAGAGATPTAGSVKIDGSNLGSALGGSIAATRLSADTSKGFSVVSFTGTGSAATVAHGLSAAPDWIIVKNRENASGLWLVYHSANTANPETEYLQLEGTAATADDNSAWNDTAPTSTVFSVGTSAASNQSGKKIIAYCWTDVSGYSKFDTYTGNGNATGPVITTGFPVAWLMVKRTDATGSWFIVDNTRDPRSSPTKDLQPNSTSTETDNSAFYTFTSTSFQLKTTGTAVNADGGTYIYMAFADTREAAFFKDVTSNGNHWTPTNLDYRDSVPDVPTNNFATFNPLLVNANVYSEGNLKNASAGNDWEIQVATMFPAGISGKWYAEFYVHTCNASGTRVGVGVTDANVDPEYYLGQASPDVAYYDINDIYTGGSKTADSNLTFAAGDIISVALNLDDGEVTFRKNNSTMTNGTQDLIANTLYTFATSNYGSGSGVIANFGQDSSFAGNHATENSNADGNGHGSFAFAPPTGFLALCSQNLPDVDIIDGTDHFNTVLYTGNNGNLDVTGVGFDPDFVWAKNRASGSYHHDLYDSVRGDNLRLNSSQTAADATGFLTFETDGFSLTQGGGINANNNAHVAWNWLAGTAFSNDASATSVGTIDSEGQVNTKAGFSIIKYSGSNSGGSFAHGLSAAPEFIIIKQRTEAANWTVAATVSGWTYSSDYLFLNTSAVKATNGGSSLFTSAPSSTVVNIGGGSLTSTAGEDLIAYCFHSVEGYSKFGSHEGNNNADGTFVYTGFRPQWLMVKNLDAAGSWIIFDSTREGGVANIINDHLMADTAAAEGTDNDMDFLSNGFKCRRASQSFNTAHTFVYFAFADQPFKFSNAR